MHSRNQANSEYVSYAAVDCKGVEFIGNQQVHSQTYTDTQIYILVQMMQIDEDENHLILKHNIPQQTSAL